ncbi:hypothetical protein FGIG_02531 [Fasciola gigantica]|uniref:Uncharacterized protein n=1 Tax=Fasciola gigantica TaxID=46835 RepID=A0A504YQ29_FASGI|nr:hypothetical protein FGIG_02531 [Fasciola gigantica]
MDVAQQTIHYLVRKSPQNFEQRRFKLGNKALKAYHGSMPNLTETWTKKHSACYPTSIEGGCDVSLPTKEVQLRIPQDQKGKKFLNPQKTMPRTRSYNFQTTLEQNSSISQAPDIRWKTEQNVGRFRNEEYVTKKVYPRSPSDVPGPLMYDGTEIESVVSEGMENETLPLTFTQATNALNNLQLENDRPTPPLCRYSGARSAESLYDVDDSPIEDSDLNFRYEKLCEAELYEQNVLLRLMRMEQRSWEGRIENLLQYRNELENRLRMLRYNRRQALCKSSYRLPYVRHRLPAVNLPNTGLRKCVTSAGSTVWSAPKPFMAEYAHGSSPNRRHPIGFPQYVSGSMDSIDDLGRSPLISPEETEKPSGQLRALIQHHDLHNEYGMQRAEFEQDRPPFLTTVESEGVPRGELIKPSNDRYSMFDEPLIDPTLVSPFPYTGVHSKQWSPHSPVQSPEIKLPHQRRQVKSVYVKSPRRFPQTTVLPQVIKPPSESYEPGEQHIKEKNKITSDTSEDLRTNYLDHVSRAEIRRRVPEAEKKHRYSHNRMSAENSNVRRRQCVPRELRENRTRRFITTQEMENMELFSEPEYLANQNSPSTPQHPQVSTEASVHDPRIPPTQMEYKGASQFHSTNSPVDPVDSDPNERSSLYEQLQCSPEMRSNKPMPSAKSNSMFDPLVEHSEEDGESVRTTTPMDELPKDQSESFPETTPFGLKVSSAPNEALPNRLLARSSAFTGDSQESGRNTEKPVDDPSGQLKGVPPLIVLPSSAGSPENGRTLENEHDATASVQNKARTSFVYHPADEFVSNVFKKHTSSKTSSTSGTSRVVPFEMRTSLCIGDDRIRIRKNAQEIISVNQPVRLICLGPFDGREVEYHFLTLQTEDAINPPRTRPPSWIGLCFGNCNVSVYDIENQKVSGQMTTNQTISFAALIPQPRIIQNCLTQLIFAVTGAGDLVCVQWNLTGYLKEQDGSRHPQWEAENHELGINIFDRLNDDGCRIPHVCCVAPQQLSGSGSNTGSRSPRSPLTNEKELSIGYFSFLAASLVNSDKKNVTTVRLCRWVSRISQLKLALCVDKTLHCEPDCSLVGITYAEIGGAPSICLCLTRNVFWFSFRSADLVSSMRLPTCVQPATLLPSVWPYKFFGSCLESKPSGRLWAAMCGRHLLELSAFDSQRRRDSSDRGSLALLYVYPSDSLITTLVSTFYEEEVVRNFFCRKRSTVNLFVHLQKVTSLIKTPPNHSALFCLQVPDCVLGFCCKDDLVFHIVRDHYYADCPTTVGEVAICPWPSCDQVIKNVQERMNYVHVEKHAMQHAYEP